MGSVVMGAREKKDHGEDTTMVAMMLTRPNRWR